MCDLKIPSLTPQADPLFQGSMGGDLSSPLPLILLLSVQQIQSLPRLHSSVPSQGQHPHPDLNFRPTQTARLSTVGRAVGGIGDRSSSCRLNLATMMWSLSLFLHLTY